MSYSFSVSTKSPRDYRGLFVCPAFIQIQSNQAGIDVSNPVGPERGTTYAPTGGEHYYIGYSKVRKELAETNQFAYYSRSLTVESVLSFGEKQLPTRSEP